MEKGGNCYCHSSIELIGLVLKFAHGQHVAGQLVPDKLVPGQFVAKWFHRQFK